MLHASHNSLIDRIYEAPAHEDGWSSVVPALEAGIGARVAIFAQRTNGVSMISACSKSSAEMNQDYEQRLWPEDRAMRRLRGAPAGEIVVDTDIISPGERGRSAFYGGWLGAHGLERGIYASVWQQEGEDFVVSARRHAGDPDFTSDHAELLRALAPHFARSLKIWRAVQRERQQRDAALKAADRSEIGLVLADGAGKVHFANGTARRALRDGVLTLAGGSLRAASAQGRILLAAALRAAVNDQHAAECGLVLPACRAGEALSLRVAPAPGAGRSGYGALAMLLLGGSGRPVIEPMLARAAFGLTDAEARLLAALASGARLSSYASGARISVTTAKTHLRALFDKTGERRQADLIRRALASPVLRQQHGG